jgi:hypothetical protein
MVSKELKPCMHNCLASLADMPLKHFRGRILELSFKAEVT